MLDLLDILNINSLFLIGFQDADDIEVGRAILVVHLLSHCQYALKFTLDSRFLYNFSFNALLDSFSLVYVSTWELPWFAFTLPDTPSLLDQQDLFLVIYHDATNSDEMVTICWESICDLGISPKAHEDVVSSLVRVMEIEPVL